MNIKRGMLLFAFFAFFVVNFGFAEELGPELVRTGRSNWNIGDGWIFNGSTPYPNFVGDSGRYRVTQDIQFPSGENCNTTDLYRVSGDWSFWHTSSDRWVKFSLYFGRTSQIYLAGERNNDPWNSSKSFSFEVRGAQLCSTPRIELYGEPAWGSSWKHIGNFNITALSLKKVYQNITFLNDGVQHNRQTVPHGRYFTKPADPVKAGYDFIGWKNGDSDFSFSEGAGQNRSATPATTDLTLRAAWRPVQPQTRNMQVNLSQQIPAPANFITNQNALPPGTTYRWKDPTPVVNPNSIASQSATIIVDYPGSDPDVEVPVTITFRDNIPPTTQSSNNEIPHIYVFTGAARIDLASFYIDNIGVSGVRMSDTSSVPSHNMGAFETFRMEGTVLSGVFPNNIRLGDYYTRFLKAFDEAGNSSQPSRPFRFRFMQDQIGEVIKFGNSVTPQEIYDAVRFYNKAVGSEMSLFRGPYPREQLVHQEIVDESGQPTSDLPTEGLNNIVRVKLTTKRGQEHTVNVPVRFINPALTGNGDSDLPVTPLSQTTPIGATGFVKDSNLYPRGTSFAWEAPAPTVDRNSMAEQRGTILVTYSGQVMRLPDVPVRFRDDIAPVWASPDQGFPERIVLFENGDPFSFDLSPFVSDNIAISSYTFADIGALGFTLDEQQGRISGVMSLAGQYTRWISAVDAAANQAQSRLVFCSVSTTVGAPITKAFAQGLSLDEVLTKVNFSFGGSFCSAREITKQVVDDQGLPLSQDQLPRAGSDNRVKVKLTTASGSTKTVEVIVNFTPEADSYAPVAKMHSIPLDPNTEIDPELFITKPANFPATARFSWKTDGVAKPTINQNSLDPQSGIVLITYSDGSVDEVRVTVNFHDNIPPTLNLSDVYLFGGKDLAQPIQLSGSDNIAITHWELKNKKPVGGIVLTSDGRLTGRAPTTSVNNILKIKVKDQEQNSTGEDLRIYLIRADSKGVYSANYGQSLTLADLTGNVSLVLPGTRGKVLPPTEIRNWELIGSIPTKGKNNHVKVLLTNRWGQTQEVDIQIDFDQQDELYAPQAVLTTTPRGVLPSPKASIGTFEKTKNYAADLGKDTQGVSFLWEEEPDISSVGIKNAKVKVIYPDQTFDLVNVQVEVKDTQAPEITGETSKTFDVGSDEAKAYQPFGAISVIDNYDQNLTPNCNVNPPYNPEVANTYIVTCNVRDSSNNPAQEFRRTIVIREVSKTDLEAAITAAQQKLNEDKVVNDQKKRDLETLITQAQTAKDNPNLTAAERDDLIRRLNEAQLTKDTKNPEITGETSKTFEVGSGNALAYDPKSLITVTDDFDQTIATKLDCQISPAYNAHQVGTYVVSCEATDNAGNHADQFRRTVSIVPIDKTDLDQLINESLPLLNEEKLIDDEKKADLQRKLDEAKTQLKNDNLTREQKIPLMKAIHDAIGALNYDREAPACLNQLDPCIQADITAPTNKNVTLSFTVNEPLKKTPEGWTQTPGSNTYTKVITENSAGSVEVEDRYGNKRNFPWSVSNIDRTAPEGTIEGEPTDWTNQTITLTLRTTKPVETPTGWTKISDQEFSKQIPQNATETFRITDKVGNTSVDIRYTVEKIDKEKPVLTSLSIEGDKNLIKDVDVKVNFAANDTGGSQIKGYECKLNDGDWKECTAPFTIANADLKEGENQIAVRVLDHAGNDSTPEHPGDPFDPGNPHAGDTIIINKDTTAPQFTNLEDKEFDEDSQISPFVLETDDQQATIRVLDGLPEGLVLNASEISGTPVQPGEYTVNLETSDPLGNKRGGSFKITVKDKTAPDVRLNGATTISLIKGVDVYQELGATCTDNLDPDCTVEIRGDTVDVNQLRPYTITYTAVDKAGNSKTERRVVTVVSGDSPVIDLKGDAQIEIELGTDYEELGATARDAEDDNDELSAKILIDSTQVDTKHIGHYEVSYNVTDSSGNPAPEMKRIVIVKDTTKPEIKALADQEKDEKTDFNIDLTIEDLDFADSSVSGLPQGLTYDKDKKQILGATEKVGIHKITVEARDRSKNRSSITFNLTIKDKTAPEIGIVHPNPDPAREKTFSWTGSDNYSLENVLKLSYALVDDGVACDETQSFIAGTTVTLSDETYNGKRICVKAEDEAGNISYKLSEAITGIDKTAPLAPKLENKRWKRKKPDFVYILPLVNEEKETLTVVSVENLPEGLEYKDGKIQGTPTKRETKTVSVTYQDAAGNQVIGQFDIKIYVPNTRDYCPNGDFSGSDTDGTCANVVTIDPETPVLDKPVNPEDTSDKEGEKELEKDLKPEREEKSEQIEKFENAEIYNPTIIDGICYTRRPHHGILDSTKISTSEEFKKALSFMWSYEMTMYDSVDGYDPYRNLSREEAAKMFSQFAMNVLCRKPDKNLKINYSDTENADPTLKPYIELAYQLGVMKGSGKGDGEFRPFDYISKAEVNAVLIRMILKSYLDEGQSIWYQNYNQVATDLGILTQGAGMESVSRNNVSLMLFRAYKDQVFDWRDIDYFSFVLKVRDHFVK